MKGELKMEAIWEQVTQVVGPYIPRLVGAVGILIVGWLVALLVAAIVRGLLRRTTIDDRLAHWIAGEERVKAIDLEAWIAKGVYYLLMLFVLVGFFQTLGLTVITEPLNRLLTQVFEFAPRLLAAGVLLLVAWVVATVLRLVITKLLGATGLDQRLTSEAGLKDQQQVPLTKTVADALYWLIFLLFLPAVLGTLALEGILQPVQSMMSQFLGFLPNMVAASLTLVVGWFIARIVRQIVTNLFAAVGLDRLGEKVGLTGILGGQKLSGVLGLVVYVLILVPVLIAALNTLGLEAVTGPASNMLNTLLVAVPSIFGAALLLTISYVIGRVVAGVVANLLAGLGFNAILARLGLGKEPGESERTPSAVAGSLILVAIMLFAATEAARLLGFAAVADLLVEFLFLAGRIVLALAIFGVGLYLANLAGNAVRGTGTAQAGLLATSARLAIILLTGAMALRHMGLANEIINLAFGLVVGAVAVAIAIAFGLGGRDIASRQLDGWIKSIRPEEPGK
jgi:hypothetical protein